jgi:cob(I)alamin adenosyltransferase
MAKKELTKLEHNNKVWAEVKELEDKIKKIKLTLYPAELPKQASLNECNALARKANIKPVKVDPKKVSAEKGV